MASFLFNELSKLYSILRLSNLRNLFLIIMFGKQLDCFGSTCAIIVTSQTGLESTSASDCHALLKYVFCEDQVFELVKRLLLTFASLPISPFHEPSAEEVQQSCIRFHETCAVQQCVQKTVSLFLESISSTDKRFCWCAFLFSPNIRIWSVMLSLPVIQMKLP